MKKFFSLVLALVMALSLTTVAWGATTVTDQATLKAALGTSGDVVLGNDIVLTEMLTVPAGVTINLDLNGNKLTGPDDGTSNWYAFKVLGKLTMDDTSAEQDGQIWAKCYGVYVRDGGTFVMDGGKIDATNSAILGTAIVNYGGTVIVNDGVIETKVWGIVAQSYSGDAVVEVNNGTFTMVAGGTPEAGDVAALISVGGEYSAGSETATINNGEFNGESVLFVGADGAAAAKATIVGGEVNGDVAATGDGEISITGGTFADDSAEAYLAPGSTVTIDGDTVVKNTDGSVAVNPVAQIGTTKYTTLADAVAAADDGDTIVLLKNSKANVTVGKNVTIDPNGYKYTGKVTAKTGYQLFKNSSGNYVVTAVATKGDTFDLYLADDGMNAALKAKTPDVAGLVFTEKAAHTNQDGSGNVAYIVANSGDYYVKTTTPYTTSYAVTYAGKTDVLYYVNVGSAGAGYYAYEEEVTAFNKFSTYDKCGCVTAVPAATDVYFETEDGTVYKALATVTAGATNYLLNGKIVSAGAEQTVVDHKFVASGYKYDTTYKVNVPTSALCTKCLMTSTTIYKDGKVPAGLNFYELYEGAAATGYSVVAEAAVVAPSTPSTGKVESAATFDAGIAMYVGMSVLAATGSAVVIGKKKD